MVEPGDKIVEVNGKRGAKGIVRELGKQVTFSIFLSRKIVPNARPRDNSPGRPLALIKEGDESEDASEVVEDDNVIERKIYVEVNRCHGEDLGVDLTWPKLKIVSISWQGLIGRWNAKIHKDHNLPEWKVIRPGDVIVEANKHSRTDKMLDECKRKAMLNLVLLRRTPKDIPETLSPQKSAHVFEDTRLNPVWATIKRNLRAHAYNLGGVDWTQLFHQGDRYDSGLLTFEMFTLMIRKQGKISSKLLSDKDLEVVYAALDADDSGEVELAEFIRWMGIDADRVQSESDDDSDAGNPLSGPGLNSAVGKVVRGMREAMYNIGSANWPIMFKKVDRSGDGMIGYMNSK